MDSVLLQSFGLNGVLLLVFPRDLKEIGQSTCVDYWMGMITWGGWSPSSTVFWLWAFILDLLSSLVFPSFDGFWCSFFGSQS